MNTTLWIIVALVVGNLAATYVTSKIDMYIMNKAWSEYGCDDILIRFKSRFLGLSFITACAVLWPIAYPAITIRAYVKYKKAKKKLSEEFGKPDEN